MIGIGSDHGGFALKEAIKKHLEERGLEYKDYGTYSDASCDYPVYGRAVAKAVAAGECQLGILICGTGIGMSICANKFNGIRAAGFFRSRYLHSSAVTMNSAPYAASPISIPKKTGNAIRKNSDTSFSR